MLCDGVRQASQLKPLSISRRTDFRISFLIAISWTEA